MRKLLLLTAITCLFVSCASIPEEQKADTYEEVSKKIEVKESKLTSLRYLKKICKITKSYNTDSFTVYELDDGKGVFLKNKVGKGKWAKSICLLVKDGELYGRWVEPSKRGVVLTYNLHNNRCRQTEHAGDMYIQYYTTDSLEKIAKNLKAEMIRLSEALGLLH